MRAVVSNKYTPESVPGRDALRLGFLHSTRNT